MKYVLDASVGLAWVTKSEESSAANDMRRLATPYSLIVPSIWPLEVANTLTRSVLLGKIERWQIEEAISVLSSLEIYVAQETYWPPTPTQVEAMLQHRLTAYDWTYIRLALQYEIPLLTLDKRMREGAAALDVELAPS